MSLFLKNKYLRLFIFSFCISVFIGSAGLSAQDIVRVAVMPVTVKVDEGQLEQMDRISDGLQSVMLTSLADQGLMVLTMGENNLALDEASAQAIARNMGADYLFTATVNKIGEAYNITGQMEALTAQGQSSQRSTVSVETPYQLPQGVERLVFLNTDHLVEDGTPVVSVDIVGNTMVDSQAILNNLRLKPGGGYNEIKATSDLKRIYALGYFEDVEIQTQNVSGGKAVRFVVTERPQLGNIVFRGNKLFEREELLEVIGIRPNDIPSERDIADSVTNIKMLYTDKGRSNVRVVTHTENSGGGAGTLIYDISEGGKVYIESIEFEGNESYSAWTLSNQIETSERNFLLSWFDGSGKLNQEKLSGDAQRLESYYHNNGFLQARVGDPVVSDAEGGGLIITFPIVEGARFKVGEVSIGGQTLETDIVENLTKSMHLGAEEWMSREIMQADVKALQTYYANKGYANSTVEPNISGPFEDDTLNVEYLVTLNQKVYFDRITIVGNDKTRDKVIRRQLSVVEGDLYSASRLEASQANLMRSTYFEQVNLVPGPSDSDDKMNLRVQVKERPTGSFEIGGGYSSYNSVFGVIRLTQDNLFGYGRRLTLEANVGSRDTLYDLSYTDPWVFDIPLTMGLDVFRYENEYEYYTRSSTGAGIRAGYPLGANFYLSARYVFENIDIDSDPNIDSTDYEEMEEYTKESIATVTLRRDTRNHYFFPSEGSVTRLSYAKASHFLGGETDFSRYEIEGAKWFPLPFFKGASVMVHGEMGYMTEDSADGLPTYEKYMIGGINDLRGYDWYSVSPTDPSGLTLGGEKMMLFNVEAAFPILKDEGLYGVLFFDAGNVWSESGCSGVINDDGTCSTGNTAYSFSDLRKSVGGGLRYLSPMGPFRVEYGYPLDRKEGEKGGQWEFTMGAMF